MPVIRVLINGAKGRMGQEAVQAVSADPELELVGQTDLGDDLSAELKRTEAQVAVDFTTAEVAFHNTRLILDSGVRPVIGTSGLLPEQVSALQARCSELGLGGVIAPNFAIGAVLMMKFSAEAARYLPHVEILEIHHDRKADAPSGTAVKTADLISRARQTTPPPLEERELYEGARGASVQGIPVHSVRLPGFVAHQEVIFGGKSESLTLRHDSLHRESFMPGVCLACKKAPALQELVYGLEHVL